MYSCPKCKNVSFPTPQALGGHITHHHKIMEKKGKAKLYMQSVPHKCKVCNHVCHRAGTQFPHDECVHPHPGIASTMA
jgi:phage FluMu protein Com